MQYKVVISLKIAPPLEDKRNMQSARTGPRCNFSLPLFILCSCLHLVNGFYVKNCNIKGSLKNPQNLKVLCERRKLTSFPENLPERARVLDASVNSICTIKKKDLVYLSDLTHLNLSHNVISYIEEEAFASLVALQELNMAQNRLASIPGRLFQSLSNLTVLRLDNNRIAFVSPSTFIPLIHLESVNISENRLGSIQQIQVLFTLPCVKDLYIGRNNFTVFQTPAISNMSWKFNTLDLSGNPLQLFRVTTDVFPALQSLDLAFVKGRMTWDVRNNSYLRNVKHLNLSGIDLPTEEMRALVQAFNFSLVKLRLYHLGESRVKPLVDEACKIQTLRTLRLRSNDIRSISPEELKYCTSVTTLDLSANVLVNISALAFRSMRKLNELDLSHNRLKSVPSAINNLSKLEKLDLSYNSISTLRCTDFVNLDKLMTLYMYRNNLHSLENCAFQNMSNLRKFTLSMNKLLRLKGYFASGLGKLDYLEVAHNKLNAIHKGDFKCLLSLTRLELNDNQIENIKEGAFDGLTSLEYINLQSNKITHMSLTPSVFSGLVHLKVLLLNNNYISYPGKNSLRYPPFVGLSSLTFLQLHSQGHEGMQNIPSNFLQGLTSLQYLLAGNLNINSLHPLTFSYTPNLYHLDLSKNVLLSLSSALFLPTPHISRLYMVGTGLQSIDFLMQANLVNIEFLKLQKNKLSVINQTVMVSMPRLFYFDVEGNGFSCDCINAWFIKWARSNENTQVINADQLTCNYPPHLRGNQLINLDTDPCSVNIGYFCFILTTVFVLVTMLSSFLYHFLRWQVVYAYYLFLAYLYDRKQLKNQEKHFQYDAFISYNTQDELWVINELLPQLEGQQGWRLCLHHRDFQPGKPIIDNIVDGIYKSRKTICVISRHYLESEWCSREIQVASFRLFDEKKDVLVLVFLEDIPAHQLSPHYRMRSLIKKRTYLSWPKPGQDTQVFWHKLKKALESTSTCKK